jgi:hypothetical protein
MPANINETRELVRIINKYVPLEQIRSLAAELRECIASSTKNDSLKVTIENVAAILEKNSVDKRGRDNVHYIGGKELGTYAHPNR